MPKYKLTYFNARGRAEVVRYVFALAGAEYEDHRIEGADWPTLKPTMPTGTLPVLEVDGKMVAQSQAIARYVAREFDLAGDNNLEMAQCEQVMETLVDMGNDTSPLAIVGGEKDEAKKAELKKSIFEDKIKTKLQYLDNFLAANGGEFFVGKKFTVADVAALFRLDRVIGDFGDDALNDFPKLAAHREKVSKEPKIAAWIEKRPKTNFFMPTGTLPVLEIDGKRLSQSLAITRYLAREFNLAGDTNFEMAQCEQVLETIVDIANDLMPVFHEKDEAKKAELKKSVFEEKIKTKLKYIENMLAANGGDFFVGKKFTVADLGLLNMLTRVQLVTGNDLKDVPKLVAHKEKVSKEPKIAAWLEKRPKTPF
ncbi:hematopoietic prostaglandin D synthase-like [Amphiura filiformis]|uniref:hematopoietic prostaglandin D synthase-like n=1 Tax=Amphiura filiformis TaxID=82378 RepID=UPI003B214BB4